jgi:hypothetical protein
MRCRRHWWRPGDPLRKRIVGRCLRLSIGAEGPVRIGLGAVLRQRIADDFGLNITGISIAVEGSKSVLTDRNGQPTPGIRQSMRVHQLVILTHIRRLIIGRGDQAEPSLLRFRSGLCPELGLLHREGERARSDRGICEWAPGDVRGVDHLHHAGSTVGHPPLWDYRYGHEIVKIVIAP